MSVVNPPRDQGAEMGVLGSILRENSVIADVATILRAEDFYEDRNQKVFRAALALWERGKPVDTVTIADELKRAGHIDDVSYAYLADLWGQIPTAAHGVHYAEIVRDHAILRRLVQAGKEIADDAEHPTGPATDSLERAERIVFDVATMGRHGSSVTLDQCVNATLDRLDRRHDGSNSTGVLSDFIDLDRLTCGFQNGELCVMAARPGSGKTALSLAIARNAISRGEPVFMASLEMGRCELVERLLANEGRIDSYRMRHGRYDAKDADQICEAANRLRAMPLHIDDNPEQTVTRIAANARRLKMRHGIRLVIVDYLQLVTPEDRKVNREQQVARISARLKQLARECSLPVLALAQLNRQVEHRHGEKPRLADLRDSGALEQDADTVILLHRPELYEPGQHEGILEVIVAKQRNGPVGDVTLMFLKQFMRFENFAVAEPMWSGAAKPSSNGHARHWMDD